MCAKFLFIFVTMRHNLLYAKYYIDDVIRGQKWKFELSWEKIHSLFLRIYVFAFSRHKINRNDPDVENIYWNLWPVEFYRMLQYKHFEVWLVVPWFTVLKMITRLFFFPVLLNYRSVSQQRTTYSVPYDVISGVIAGLQKVYPHFSVMPDQSARWSSSWM